MDSRIREDACVLLDKLGNLFENAYDSTEDHAFVSPREEMIDAIVEFRTNSTKNELDALKDVVTALESLPGGQSYSTSSIQQWLCGPMVKAINNARSTLGIGE